MTVERLWFEFLRRKATIMFLKKDKNYIKFLGLTQKAIRNKYENN